VETINKIESQLRFRLKELKQAKEQGKKIIGYVPGGYFPEELVIAAGAIPVCMIRGGDKAAIDASLAYIDRWLDTFYRAQIGSCLSGEDPYYNIIDILFDPLTDNSNRALSDTLAYHTDIEIFPFGVPHTKDESAHEYYLHGINRAKKRIEELTGVEITTDKLNEAIVLCNRERELLRKISLMRQSDPSPVDSKHFVMMNHASMIIDKNAQVKILESVVEDLDQAEPSGNKGPRILLTGSTLAWGDNKILAMIEEAGGNVVIENFAEGITPYWYDIKTTGDPMKALAEKYFMDRAVPAWFRPCNEMHKNLVRLAKDFSVNGVIWYQLMIRDSYKIESYYFPEILKKETGLSMLTLESDYDPYETGQMRTRIETYIESIVR